MSGFNIKKAPSEFVILANSFESFLNQEESDKCEVVLPEKQSEDGVSVIYILPSAFDELNEHINWKARTATNLSEQGGILIGNVFRDKDTQLVCGVVRHVIPSTKSGNATYIQFTHDDWIAMYKKFEGKYAPAEGEVHRLSVIGWYHTHPNMPVNMSAIDKQTHISFFPNVHQFSVIINPQRGMWAVFNGAECNNCNGFIYYDKNTVFIESELNDIVSDTAVNASPHTDSAATNSFVIKRQPHPLVQDSSAHPANNGNTQANRMPGNRQNDRQRNQQRLVNQYRGYSQQYMGRTFYFTFHEPSNRKNYIISEEMIKKLQKVLTEWNFSNNESVTLSYIVGTTPQCYFHDEHHEYYPIDNDTNAYAQGFICEKNPNEYLAFHSTPVYNCRDVKLAVLFSNELPDYRILCKKYCDYDCLLWFNSKDTQDFSFFRIENRRTVVQANTNFNIKNRPAFENNLSESVVLLGREIYNTIMSSLSVAIDTSIVTESNGIPFQTMRYQIHQPILQKVFEQIKRYGKFTESVGIVIGYYSKEYPHKTERNRTIILPTIDKFSELWFLLGNGQTSSFKYLDNDFMYGGASRRAKFAFVISNYDLDIDSTKKKLLGYTTAFCFNIENQSYRFYQLF